MKTILYIVLLFSIYFDVFSSDLYQVINLEGSWRFKIGDNEIYADPEYYDISWEKLKFPDVGKIMNFQAMMVMVGIEKKLS